MEPHLLRVLFADNAWLDAEPLDRWLGRHVPTPLIPRRLHPQPDDRVVLVIGPRQSGKSTLIWKLLAEADRPALYLNCEDPTIAAWLRSPALFLADVAALAPPEATLFFEECQALEEAGLFLKGLVDRRTGRALYATGSSSFHLEAKTRESLAGRALRHQLLPFSMAEIGATLSGPPLVREHKLRQELDRQLIFGGYPRVRGSGSPQQELATLVESFVVRDVSDRFQVRRVDAFRKVLALAASQIGNLVNFSEWATLAEVGGDTVAEYCRLLEETHVLRLVRPFVGGKRAEITSTPKAFFVDNGVRNQLFGGFVPFADRADRGALLENLVFTELIKHLNPLLDSVRYWRSRSGAEVDFVVEHQGRLIACEVKTGDARGHLGRSAHSFLDAYHPEALLVVHSGSKAEQAIGDTRVVFLGAHEVGVFLGEMVGEAPDG
ncbi:MAG: ATP-binding protein [Thermoanaerobaculia bacterium]|nr:ATP-binding protein [Thermoanaerobaculia bacterium]